MRVAFRTVAAALLGVALVQGLAAPASARGSVSVSGGAYRAVARFTVTYSGSGSWRTTYHSNPPNPGGNPDTNDAQDSSKQAWSIEFRSGLTVPRCRRQRRLAHDPCRRIKPLHGALGSTNASGRIQHTHVDGLFVDQNRSINCEVGTQTPQGTMLHAALTVRYERRVRALVVTALDPVSDALLALPTACPAQGDSVDGLLDNYYTPGFSFDPQYSSDRWFSSRAVVLPLAKLHRARRITISLSNTPAGTPPANCSVQHPYERCATGGSWAGTLTLSRR